MWASEVCDETCLDLQPVRSLMNRLKAELLEHIDTVAAVSS